MPDPSRAPRVDRTLYTPVDVPATITLWFCPACGRRIEGSYNLEPARARCTKTWHLANPVRQEYAAVADASARSGRPQT